MIKYCMHARTHTYTRNVCQMKFEFDFLIIHVI